MAKRRRLTPIDFALPSAEADAPAAPEGRTYLRPGLAEGAPPIAHVAGDASAASALAEVAGALTAARAEGRLVQRLPLAMIDAAYLVRDRLETDEEELYHLMTSLAAHGQRTPIDVAEVDPGRYGLISGWRRITALARLFSQTGEARFATVLALVRRPDTAEAAYVAMVEENEVRLGLSYYERARIAARAVDLGVFETEKLALQRLFAAASRPKRSKIGSFLVIYRRLDPFLRFPAAIPERLGLSLAKLIETEPQATAALIARLETRPARYALDELTVLTEAVEAVEATAAVQAKAEGSGPASRLPPATGPRTSPRTEELRPGVVLRQSGRALNPVLTLSGPGVDQHFHALLVGWLQKDRSPHG